MPTLMRKEERVGPGTSQIQKEREVLKLGASPNLSGILGNLVSGLELRVTTPLDLILTWAVSAWIRLNPFSQPFPRSW